MDHQIIKRNSPTHRLWAREAAREAKRVLPLFEKEYPDDKRPRQAVEAIKAWGQGKLELGMAKVRKLSLDSHAAARQAKTDAARFAARAAGHAVATWHVPTHALGVPYYVNKAIMAHTQQPKKKEVRKKYVKKHNDGTVWAKGTMLGTKPDGYWEWFRKEGTKMRSGYFKKGKQTGTWTTYDKKGKVYKVTEMK